MDGTLERITKLMKEQKILDQELISFLGLPKGAFANWRRDNGNAYYRYIDKIADRIGVTIDYLIRGHEIKSDSLTSRETELVENYRKLTDESRKIISTIAKLFIEEIKIKIMENIYCEIRKGGSRDFENRRKKRNLEWII